MPAELDGHPVTALAAGALDGLPCREIVLPQGLARLEEGAIRNCDSLTTLTLFDDLTSLHADAVQDCPNLQTLRLQAATAPKYSGGYFATFADKYDRLLALRQQKKLVLFSGSSTRFGYDSALLDEAPARLSGGEHGGVCLHQRHPAAAVDPGLHAGRGHPAGFPRV